MSTRRNALGRGLGALIPTAAPPASPAFERREPEPAYAEPLEIPIARIVPNPQQPRRRFDDAELARLAESIGRHGVLQPVVVRERDGGYELVVGERRWRAARLAGRETLPAVVKDVASPDLLELAHGQFGVGRQPQQPRRIVLEQHACLGERAVAGSAIEQPVSDGILEPADSLADGRLGAVQLPRRDREAPLRGDGHERAKVVDLHG